MSLKLYNSLSAQKEVFKPINKDHVTLYVCGPTVYGDAHLGHAKTYISFDVILRYFKYRGYQTFYVQNITDVGHLVGDQDEGEDKILKKARELKKEPMAIAEYYTQQYFEVMDQMGVLRPDISPRATGHIPEQLEAIQTLIERGFAYEANGSVYFDVSKAPEYGKLSNRSLDEMISGTREAVRSEKKSPNDFALWKLAEPGHLMRWKDPWSGAGFPGWHTECAVMSTKYLGDAFDIHGGGMDLKFPHHECEIAQAYGLGKPFAKYWMHSNMLTIEGQKMSKSLENFVTLQDAFQTFSPIHLRYFFVASHYRSVVDYSQNAITTAATSLQRLHQLIRSLRSKCPQDAKPTHQWFQEYQKRFCDAMDDDFSTPQALAVLFDLSREVNTLMGQHDANIEAIVDAESIFSKLAGGVLGLIPDHFEKSSSSEKHMDQLMNLVIELREHSRQRKDYAQSDLIRNRMEEMGIKLNDSREGTTWEWKERS
ncbi:cysteine--tRNA ligase [Deltaproteobacteria bacterium TL4]